MMVKFLIFLALILFSVLGAITYSAFLAAEYGAMICGILAIVVASFIVSHQLSE